MSCRSFTKALVPMEGHPPQSDQQLAMPSVSLGPPSRRRDCALSWSKDGLLLEHPAEPAASAPHRDPAALHHPSKTFKIHTHLLHHHPTHNSLDVHTIGKHPHTHLPTCPIIASHTCPFTIIQPATYQRTHPPTHYSSSFHTSWSILRERRGLIPSSN